MSRTMTHGRVLTRVLLPLIMLVVVGVLFYVGRDFNRFGSTPLQVTAAGESIDIERGASFGNIVAELHQRGLSDASVLYWRLLAEQMRAAGKLHAGEYAVDMGMTPRQLLANMVADKVLQHNLTVVDGWTFAQLRQALDRAAQLKHDSTGLEDAVVMQEIHADGEAPEGRFLPETYAYVKGDSDLDVLKRAYLAMRKTLDALWPLREKNLPLNTPYDALILASIVQKETARGDERNRVAGVFVRRLEQHMLLQTDPTVIYGMGASYDGNLRKADLTTDTPFNTYTRPGLPPTPIALPGKLAIEAALHPAAGDEVYFVARGDGTHIFASTLEEQNRNVDCYQRKHCHE